MSRLKSCESACASVAEPLIRLRALRELQVIESDVNSVKREGISFLEISVKYGNKKKELEVFQLDKPEELQIIHALRGVSFKRKRDRTLFHTCNKFDEFQIIFAFRGLSFMGKGSEHSFFLQVVSELMPKIGSRHEVDEDVTKRVAENLEQVRLFE